MSAQAAGVYKLSQILILLHLLNTVDNRMACMQWLTAILSLYYVVAGESQLTASDSCNQTNANKTELDLLKKIMNSVLTKTQQSTAENVVATPLNDIQLLQLRMSLEEKTRNLEREIEYSKSRQDSYVIGLASLSYRVHMVESQQQQIGRLVTKQASLEARQDLMMTQSRDQVPELNDLKKQVADLSANHNELQEQLDDLRKMLNKCETKLTSVISAQVSWKTNFTGNDCADLYKNGVKQSGVYTIQPKDGLGNMEVYCDMVTDGGGWTVFQRRQDGSVDFYRGWSDYKAGFGDLNGEFWLGNDNIHRLTHQGAYTLRVDLEDFSNEKVYAAYDAFSVGSEKVKYKLALGFYSGTAGDSLTVHKGQSFSTKDRDNDTHSSNCAVTYKGAWWYKGCHQSNLNGLYHYGKHKSGADGVNWYHYKGHNYSLKRTSMKIRPVGFKSSK